MLFNCLPLGQHRRYHTCVHTFKQYLINLKKRDLSISIAISPSVHSFIHPSFRAASRIMCEFTCLHALNYIYPCNGRKAFPKALLFYAYLMILQNSRGNCCYSHKRFVSHSISSTKSFKFYIYKAAGHIHYNICCNNLNAVFICSAC